MMPGGMSAALRAQIETGLGWRPDAPSARTALEQAITHCGSQAELARRIGKKQAHVWNWLRRDRQVPAEAVLAIERATDGAVSRHALRPDLYPVESAA